jgi:hypothetical protein
MLLLWRGAGWPAFRRFTLLHGYSACAVAVVRLCVSAAVITLPAGAALDAELALPH